MGRTARLWARGGPLILSLSKDPTLDSPRWAGERVLEPFGPGRPAADRGP